MTNWKLPRPNAYTPFFRRFTDERARDQRELRQLYEEVRALFRASKFSKEEARGGTFLYIFRAIESDLWDLQPAFCRAIQECLEFERTIFEFPEIDWQTADLTLEEGVNLKRFLRSQQHFLQHEHRVADMLTTTLVNLFGGLAGELPALSEPSPFAIPWINTVPDYRLLIERIVGTITEPEHFDFGLFTDLQRALYVNICAASNVTPDTPHNRPFVQVADSKLSAIETVETYLKGTPFADLLLEPVPLPLSVEQRFSHMHIVGGSGAGKTQLLQTLILHDLQSDEQPALIIVDSQSDLINKISKLALFDPDEGRLGDRLVLISPRDIKHPPAINVFDVGSGRLDGYDDATREQVVAGVIDTFDYLFTGLLGADLTAKQSVFFRYVARLLLAIPEHGVMEKGQLVRRNATILDMLELIDKPASYKEVIATLPPIQRNFFENDFNKSTFNQTKDQIRYRLHAILENPTLARLFTSPRTKVDLFTEINNGSIILVDTAKDFLKSGSAHFGRIFISLILQAILERAAIPEHKRRPAFLIVDEAAEYFDSSIDSLLTEARKYKLGCVLAHQFLDQCTPSLRSSLAANTSIKLASGVSMSDARWLSADMRTTPDFIASQHRLHFACHIRNVTTGAVSIPVTPGLLEEQPRLSHEAYQSLLERNRARVALIELPKPTPPEQPPPLPEEPPAPAAPAAPAAQEAPVAEAPKRQPEPKPAPEPKSVPQQSPQGDDLIPSGTW